MHSTLVTWIIAILAVLVTVIAAPQPAEWIEGVAIPLFKRSDFMNATENGIDVDALNSHVASIHAKIIRGFENNEKNMGMEEAYSLRESLLKRASANAVHLYPQEKNAWYGSIRIGTPTKVYFVVLDTASADFFVPDVVCDTSCHGHNRWNPLYSTTMTYLQKDCFVRYSDGTGVVGKLYMDDVAFSVDQFTVSDQTLCAAKSYPQVYQAPGFTADGVVGMGFGSISSYGAHSVVDLLLEQGELNPPVFSFSFSGGREGELWLSGVNTAKFVGQFTYASVVNRGFWQVTLDFVVVDGLATAGNRIATSVPAIIDTSSIVIAAPSAQVSILQNLLGGRPIGNGIYTFPCNSYTTVTFGFDGAPFPVSAKDLEVGPISLTSPNCYSSIVARDLVPGLDLWVIGLPFLKTVYTSFDATLDDPKVGFARTR